MTDWLAILLALVLLAGNAFFVGAEFALVSARRSSIEVLATEGSGAARITLRAMDRVTTMMAGAQLGITLCSLGLGAVGEPAVAHALQPVFAWAGLPEHFVHPVAFAVALVLVVYLHMVVGEMVPKNMAIASPDRAALLLGPPMYAISWVLRPLLWVMNTLANLVLKIVRVEPTEDVSSTVTADQAREYLTESHESGLLEENEMRLMAGAITLGDETANDVMVPMDTLCTLTEDSTVADAERACVTHGFSRFPMVDTNGDHLGYVHVKDLLGVPDEELDRTIRPDERHDLVTVHSDASLQDVLAAMQKDKAHMALVSEGGAVIGVVMLEDIVERMIGQVSDRAQRSVS